MAKFDPLTGTTKTTQLETEVAELKRIIASGDPQYAPYLEQLKGQLAKAEDNLRNLPERRENVAQDKREELANRVDPFAERTPEEQAAYEKSIGIIDPNDVAQFGGPNEANREVAQNELDAGVTLGPSAWEGSTSAYDGIGPSAWEGQNSAFGDAGKESKGYYSALMKSGGTDAISEADYQRRKQDAEQNRRSNTDAALQQLEQRGMGSAGGTLLAELSNQQAATGDIYSAGLDAAATAQARRDNAAAGLGNLEMEGARGTDVFSALTANGLDGFKFQQAGGQDAFTGNRNQGLDRRGEAQGELTQNTNQFNAGTYGDAEDLNIQRDWGTADNNTNTANAVLTGNAANTAAGTGAYMSALGLYGGQVLGQGNLDLNRDQLEFLKLQEDNRNRFTLEDGINLAAGVGGKLASV